MKTVDLKSKTRTLMVGDNHPIVVNCNIGVNDIRDINKELDKIDCLFENTNTTPDLMMDLSIAKSDGLIVKHIINNYNTPVGIVPAYSIYDSNSGLSDNELLETIIQYAECGIAFMTMHFTADRSIYKIAKSNRLIPTTSRGGGLVLSDTILNKKVDNIYIHNIDEIISIAKKYSFAISLGTTFRPAGIIDACDEVHIKETKKQIDICSYIQDRGVDVIIENVGHIGIKNIVSHSDLLRKANAPIMPLGPLVVDSAIGADHIAAAIGASFMGYHRCAHILNAVSPAEHMRSVFSVEDAQNAVIAAKIAAQAVNIISFPDLMELEQYIYRERAINKTCLISGNEDCTRCDILCPLNL